LRTQTKHPNSNNGRQQLFNCSTPNITTPYQSQSPNAKTSMTTGDSLRRTTTQRSSSMGRSFRQVYDAVEHFNQAMSEATLDHHKRAEAMAIHLVVKSRTNACSPQFGRPPRTVTRPLTEQAQGNPEELRVREQRSQTPSATSTTRTSAQITSTQIPPASAPNGKKKKIPRCAFHTTGSFHGHSVPGSPGAQPAAQTKTRLPITQIPRRRNFPTSRQKGKFLIGPGTPANKTGNEKRLKILCGPISFFSFWDFVFYD